MRWFGFVLVLLVLVLAGLRTGVASHQPQARAGVLELPSAPVAPLQLEGEWAFAWQRFVDPGWQALPAGGWAHVPADWNDQRADGKPPGADGWGSYALLVRCPAGERLAVVATGQRTAMRLYVNGELVLRQGEPGPSPATTWAAVNNRVPTTAEHACPLRITAHVANWDHRGGGFVRPLLAGRADALAAHRESRLAQDVLLLGAYLLAGLAGVVFWVTRPAERVPLLFGLFCVATAVYSDATGGRLLLRLLPGTEVDWQHFLRVEYFAWTGSMALFFLTVRGLFPQEVHRRAVQAVTALCVFAFVLVALAPARTYSEVAVPGQALAVAISGYVAAAIVLADRRARRDARVVLLGMLAVIVAMGADLLLIDAAGPERRFTPVGFALFLLSPAAVIARRLARGLQAEERSRSLELNARLREDVERMSRHDLKTPLNSIVGAARLLREDRRMLPEQQELVGILERAALRMLEMVNLSLGLFRMETGRYDFRPQAVNLRELCARVLVDLHPLAESHGVVLQAGTGSHPVDARAEELLCYSIVANLVKNAIEATPPGGTVTVAVRAGDPVRVEVRNPGSVDPEAAARFFSKYASAGKSGGTGLGTYSARLMARAQQGELALREDTPGETVLELTLRPVQGEPPAAAPAPGAPAAPPVPALADVPPREVLVVDDDEYNRLVLRRFLPGPPYTVQAAPDGQAALHAIGQRRPHILLVDMQMPVLSGTALVERLRQEEAASALPRTAVVMLSADDGPQAAQAARQAGADAFLAKPVSRDVLLATLRELEGLLDGPRDAALRAWRGHAPPPQAGPEPQADEVVQVEPEWAELFPQFLASQRDTVVAMGQALAAGDRARLQFLAHRAAGALALGGLRWASAQARRLELDAPGADAGELRLRIAALAQHLQVVRTEAAQA